MLLTCALAVHDLTACHPRLLAAVVPNPAPVAPPGLSGRVSTLLAWWKWGALIAGVFGLIGCGAMMAMAAATAPTSPPTAPPASPGCWPG